MSSDIERLIAFAAKVFFRFRVYSLLRCDGDGVRNCCCYCIIGFGMMRNMLKAKNIANDSDNPYPSIHRSFLLLSFARHPSVEVIIELGLPIILLSEFLVFVPSLRVSFQGLLAYALLSSLGRNDHDSFQIFSSGVPFFGV